ncbi:Transposable element Hobo transposase, partial [Frankliniella fusca]
MSCQLLEELGIYLGLFQKYPLGFHWEILLRSVHFPWVSPTTNGKRVALRFRVFVGGCIAAVGQFRSFMLSFDITMPPKGSRRTTRSRPVVSPESTESTAAPPVSGPTLLISENDAPFSTPAAPAAVPVVLTPATVTTPSSTVLTLLPGPSRVQARPRPALPPLAPLSIVIPTPSDTPHASASSSSSSSAVLPSSSTTPGSTPGSTPGTTPGSTPGSTPVSTPGGSTPRARPRARASTSTTSSSTLTSKMVYEKLCDQDYALEEPEKDWRSPAWHTFKPVIDDKKKKVGWAQCQVCFKCLKYDTTDTGISGLLKHTRSGTACKRQISDTPVLVPKVLKDNLHNKLAEKCARDLSSINGVVGVGMTNVVQAGIDIGTACPGARAAELMPCFNTVRRKLCDLADEGRKVVVAGMKEAIADGRCSATTDMWTDENRDFHYMTVTAHFTNAKFEPESWDLCTPRFPCESKTTGENIRNALVSEFTVLGFSEDEFKKVEWVTDQRANMVKALEDVKRDDCMTHCMNTALKNSLTLSFVELRKKIYKNDDATIFLLDKFSDAAAHVKKAKETPSRKVGGGVKLGALQKSIETAKKGPLMYGAMLSSVLLHQKKVVSVLQFLGLDALADYIVDNADTAREILNVVKALDKTGSVSGADLEKLPDILEVNHEDSDLSATLKQRLAEERELCSILIQVKKCKEVVKYLKTSSLSTRLSKMVKQECDTRWNSLCTMLESFIQLYEEVTVLFREKGELSRLDGIVLADMEWLVKFLVVFREETDKLQGQNYPTLPYALLVTCGLRDHCDPVFEDTPAQTILRARVSASVARKLEPTMDQKIATFLWPQYRHLLMLREEERAEVVYSTVRAMIAAPSDEEAVDAPPSPKVPRLDDRYNKWCTAGNEPGLGHLDEVDRYLQSGASSFIEIDNLLMFWKSEFDSPSRPLGKLAKLAHRLLGKPASSAPSERVFSAAGFLIQERRTRLSADIIDKTLFLHSFLANQSVMSPSTVQEVRGARIGSLGEVPDDG